MPQFNYRAEKHGYPVRLASFTNPEQYERTTSEALAMAGFHQKGSGGLKN